MINTESILQIAIDHGASDIHLSVQAKPLLRLDGILQPIPTFDQVLLPETTEKLAKEMMSAEQWQKFSATGELDFSFSFGKEARFRANVFRQRGYVSLVLRLIPFEVKTAEELDLPAIIMDLALKHSGLILVTGPTGSGKSTTLAAIIDYINKQSKKHIITLEDPIEFVHRNQESLINQREVGQDSKSFSVALRAALRQDPDVILVGEMRDLETISTALTAAETGHLVLGTLHTQSAASTIDRIIDVFPTHQQEQIRVQLSSTLHGVIAQQLLPRADQPGRIALHEILVVTPAIRHLIREKKTYQINSLIQTGAKHGMQSVDNELRQLMRQGIISLDTVELYSQDKESMKEFSLA